MCKRSNRLFFYDFHYSCKTDVGKTRKKNEDAIGCYIPQDPQVFHENGAIFVVADGVGGNLHGDIASRIAVQTIIREYSLSPVSSGIQDRLNRAIKTANETILEKSFKNITSNMATTVVVAVICKKMVYFANVGDSRAYISGPHRENGMEQITNDHTLIEEELQQGLLSKEQALEAINKNIITSSLGSDKNPTIDFFEVPILDQDKILLTTDGLTHVANDNQIFEVLRQEGVESNSKGLIDLANSLGGPDNISVYVVQPNAIHNPLPPKKRSCKVALIAVGVLLFIALLFFI